MHNICVLQEGIFINQQRDTGRGRQLWFTHFFPPWAESRIMAHLLGGIDEVMHYTACGFCFAESPSAIVKAPKCFFVCCLTLL